MQEQNGPANIAKGVIIAVREAFRNTLHPISSPLPRLAVYEIVALAGRTGKREGHVESRQTPAF